MKRITDGGDQVMHKGNFVASKSCVGIIITIINLRCIDTDTNIGICANMAALVI